MNFESFPLLTNSTYLNTAYVGLMSEKLAAFRRGQDQEHVSNGGKYKLKADENLEETHQLLGQFFGSDKKLSFVVPNFSFGVRQAISFLPKNLKILLLEDDYPSLLDAFKEYDFDILLAKQDHNIEDVIEFMLASNKIDVLALSVVQYTTGLLIDLKFLKQLKVKYPHLIIIGDGTQFLGAHTFDFKKSPFDVIATSGYKWLLAGFGNGVLIVSEEYLKISQIESTTLFNQIFNGHFNILSTASLNFALKELTRQDFQKLMHKKKQLALIAKLELTSLNYISPWVSQRPSHSSIFSLKGDKKLYTHLTKYKIECVQRGEGIRVSFHYYNSLNDLANLIKALETFK